MGVYKPRGNQVKYWSCSQTFPNSAPLLFQYGATPFLLPCGPRQRNPKSTPPAKEDTRLASSVALDYVDQSLIHEIRSSFRFGAFTVRRWWFWHNPGTKYLFFAPTAPKACTICRCVPNLSWTLFQQPIILKDPSPYSVRIPLQVQLKSCSWPHYRRFYRSFNHHPLSVGQTVKGQSISSLDPGCLTGQSPGNFWGLCNRNVGEAQWKYVPL